MILFIAPFPSKERLREGMLQRIAAVDRIFSMRKRVYVELNTEYSDFARICFSHVDDLTSTYILNPSLESHIFILTSLVREAQWVYVHSIYNAKTILPLYAIGNVVTDMHGAVPEEEKYKGDDLRAAHYEDIERISFEMSNLVITVSDRMQDHFREKYPSVEKQMLTLPVLDERTDVKNEIEMRSEKKRYRFIYAGGAQKWQQIDVMMSAFAPVQQKHDFIVLTRDRSEFIMKKNEYGLGNSVRIRTVPNSIVGDYYRTADFGFILRDDSIVNRVSCPTKLVEYISYGIIPVVMDPRIGDFPNYGYSYITLDDLREGKFPNRNELANMKELNKKVHKKIRQKHDQSVRYLRDNFSATYQTDDKHLIVLSPFYRFQETPSLRCYYETDSGLKSQSPIRKKINWYREEFLIAIDEQSKSTTFRLVLFDGPVGVRIHKIGIFTRGGMFSDKISIYTNSSYNKRSLLVFPDREPTITIIYNGIDGVRSILVELEYLLFGRDVLAFYALSGENGIASRLKRTIKVFQAKRKKSFLINTLFVIFLLPLLKIIKKIKHSN